MPFSVRLDPETEAKIRRLARASGRSKSAVVREAMAQYAVETERKGTGASALDRLKPFVGIVSTGGAQYSTDTHEKYRALLVRKHRGRRAR